MTFDDILTTGGNPVIEIPQPSGKCIYIRLVDAVKARNRLISIRFVRLLNFNGATGGSSGTLPIAITEQDIAYASIIEIE